MGSLTREKWLNQVAFCRHFVGAGYHGFQWILSRKLVNLLFGESKVKELFWHLQLNSFAWKELTVRCGYLRTPPHRIHLVCCCYCCMLLWFVPSFSLPFHPFGVLSFYLQCFPFQTIFLSLSLMNTVHEKLLLG